MYIILCPVWATCALAYVTSLIQPLHMRSKGSTLGKYGRNFRFSSIQIWLFIAGHLLGSACTASPTWCRWYTTLLHNNTFTVPATSNLHSGGRRFASQSGARIIRYLSYYQTSSQIHGSYLKQVSSHALNNSLFAK